MVNSFGYVVFLGACFGVSLAAQRYVPETFEEFVFAFSHIGVIALITIVIMWQNSVCSTIGLEIGTYETLLHILGDPPHPEECERAKEYSGYFLYTTCIGIGVLLFAWVSSTIYLTYIKAGAAPGTEWYTATGTVGTVLIVVFVFYLLRSQKWYRMYYKPLKERFKSVEARMATERIRRGAPVH